MTVRRPIGIGSPSVRPRRTARRGAGHRPPGVVLAAAAVSLVTSCTASTELDSASAGDPGSAPTPGWIVNGRALAAERSRSEPSASRPQSSASPRSTRSAEADLGDQLKAAGLTAEQVDCVDAALRDSSSLGVTVSDLVDAVSQGRAPAGLDSTTVSALMVVLGPCLSGTSLATAAAALNRQTTTPNSPASSPLAGIDMGALQTAVSQFQQALAASQNDVSRNLLLALVAALAQGGASVPPSALPTLPTSPVSPTLPTSLPATGPPLPLPPEFPVGLNLVRLVDRNVFVDNAVANGSNRQLAGCLYDRLAALTNAEVASLPPSGTNTALIEEIIRTVFTCATS